MIPHYFEPFLLEVPLLKEITEWKQLKKWNLAAVYRGKHPKFGTLIIKWGGNEMSVEARVYKELVHALGLPAPQLYDYCEQAEACILLLEDLGQYNLEQRPHSHYFIDAARQLANMRKTATKHLPQLNEQLKYSYTLTAEQFLSELNDVSLKLTADTQKKILSSLKEKFPAHLYHLYETVPLTIVHHDFMAKNLMITYDERIVPIDWSITYISPHLGDFYNLIKEAERYAHMEKDILIEAYLSEYNKDYHMLNWELTVGGLCWLIKTLRWLTYGGTAIIPGSEAWVPDLFNDLKYLSSQLDEHTMTSTL